ncbi:carboxypeptidase-like regulatory domain-containing protein [Christiangramia portivictoriae]|uniref:carboxypeptidase-like regulatory domain-containing protein n=1 Tax=Christiangramia portivictoriae TaxID=326069 RepID=UPI00054D98CB|nr:carboxypeptidase-like regulatory domain-containing protein [Christiangramia portivictoriae]
MTKQYLIFILFHIPILGWGQFQVTGVVISKNGEGPVPGVTIVEKGTRNGTVSNLDGLFSIEVSDPNAVLIFSTVGMITKEYELNGKNKITVETKWDCNKDFFDSNRIRIYAQSGFINNPIGGQIDIASPYIISEGVLKASYSYQTDSKDNNFQVGSLEFKHPISNCDFDIDFRASYRDFKFKRELDNKTYSFETDFNLPRISFIAGYSHVKFNNINTSKKYNSSGVLIGFGTSFGGQFYPEVVGKISIYKDNIEYQGKIQGGYKRFLIFLKYYKLSSFNELSLGIGYNLFY